MMPELQDTVCNRLIADGHADRAWALIVKLAAPF